MQQLWTFALAGYERQQVKSLCLELQDNYGADVCVILALLWMDSQRLSAGKDQVNALERSVRCWQLCVTGSLRRSRVAVKKSGIKGGPYRALLALELAAEKRTLAKLQQHIQRKILPGIPARHNHRPGTGLAIYLQHQRVPAEVQARAFDTLQIVTGIPAD